MDLSTLPKAAQLASLATGAPRWRPGLARAQSQGGALHSEVFASMDEAGGAACALAFALDDLRHVTVGTLEEKPVLWVQDQGSVRRSGRPYQPGLPPALRHRLIHVCTHRVEDALFALEEGLRCRDLAFVIGEIAGNPRTLDLTASRRLSLAAHKHDTPLFLIRHDAARDLSSARMRWQVRSAPSPHPCWNPAAPGRASWHAELFRARTHAPGEWILRDDGSSLVAERPASSIQHNDQANGQANDAGSERAPDHGDLADAAGAGSLAAR